MDNYNYPMGADTKDAPWNQVDNPEREIEVTVSVTLSKTVKIKVSDYEIDSGRDEDGNYFEEVDYSNCDLKEEVMKQVYLPQEAGEIIQKGFDSDEINCVKYLDIAEDLSGWNIDDFEAITEE